MKICNIYKLLDKFSPFSLQEEWDNSGLLVGCLEDEFEDIALCLDIDTDIINHAKPKTLFIVHHPIIFKGIKKIDSSFPSNILKDIIKKDCFVIAMHTNIDKTHLNKYVVQNILKQKIVTCEDFICYFDNNLHFDEFILHVKKCFNLLHVRIVNPKNYIKKIALTTGSGGDFIETIKADCFLTGDIKYHQAFNAMQNNVTLIDIGHFESERYFSEILNEYLKKNSLQAIMSDCKNPFEYR